MMRIAGCDLGKASASFVIGHVDGHGTFVVDEVDYLLHKGNPFEAFQEWYIQKAVYTCQALGATGIYSYELTEPVVVLPEDACQEAGVETDIDEKGPLNLVSIGARGYSVLTRARLADSSYQYQYLENDKCSSGTGENIQKIAGRFGLSLEDADQLAWKATSSIPITARCSVFAKSEMTHYANQGHPTADLFLGFFESIARNTRALLNRNQVEGPLYFIGGCSRIRTLKRAFETMLQQPLFSPKYSLCFEALGAAVLASSHNTSIFPLPEDPQKIIQRGEKRFQVLQPARLWQKEVTMMESPPARQQWEDEPAVLGLDLGSTGAKAVLLSLKTGEPLLDVYDRTWGNPVDASRRLIESLLAQGIPDLRAIGVTGSGREAVATLLRGVFPGENKILVLNEIVAHATGAIACDPDDGTDLSIVEIGGQDAKYIRVSGGRIVESDMNKVCSAGTGSFLEEQANFYNITEISDFIQLATEAKRPPELGQMCTVYIAEAGAQALKDRFELGDIFAGFQYSIIHNYLHRVMGQRTLAEKIFFQGKPASNPSLAWTLAAVTGRKIIVPPNPGAMGAWGIGICAIKQLGRQNLKDGPPLNLTRVLEARIAGRKEFNCKDPKCQNLCPIVRTTIVVDGNKKDALSGGACPKYELATKGLPKLAKDAPDPFRTRTKLISAYSVELPGRPVVALPETGAICGYIPWLSTLMTQLGFSVQLLKSHGKSLARGEQLCNSFDSCSPTKIAHAICDTDIPLLFFPKIVDLDHDHGSGGQTCSTEQAMPDIVDQSLQALGKEIKVLKPTLYFAQGLEGEAMIASLQEMALELELSPLQLEEAVPKAAKAQRDYEKDLIEAGQEALEYGREHKLPIVLLCGHLHVIHDKAINATIPQILRLNGAMALPMDCFSPLEELPPMEQVYWGDANRAVRSAASAREMRDVFPLLLSSFGCGPASFTEQIFQNLLEGYPHTILESDGHGGTAGFVTRVQAFLQSVRQFIGEKTPPVLPSNQKVLDATDPIPYGLDKDTKYVFLSTVKYFSPMMVSIYKAYGYEADSSPDFSTTNYNLGKSDCSGKECMDYQMIWGAFREYLEQNPPTQKTRLVQINSRLCRAGIFAVKDRMNLEKMGLDHLVSSGGMDLGNEPAMPTHVWMGQVSLDILRQLYLYHIPVEPSEGEAERLYHSCCQQLIDLMAYPITGKAAAFTQLLWKWRRINKILRRASMAFQKMDSGGDFKRVFVSGDPITKGHDFANGNLFHHLSAQKIRVVLEPFCDVADFLARQHPNIFFDGQYSQAKIILNNICMDAIRRKLYFSVRQYHPWLPMPNVPEALQKASGVIGTSTVGGAVLSIGNVLREWDTGSYHGVVMASCWGCDNGLINESLLRYFKEIPLFFHYDDGTPLDERKISSFAFRLHQRSKKDEVPALV